MGTRSTASTVARARRRPAALLPQGGRPSHASRRDVTDQGSLVRALETAEPDKVYQASTSEMFGLVAEPVQSETSGGGGAESGDERCRRRSPRGNMSRAGRKLRLIRLDEVPAQRRSQC